MSYREFHYDWQYDLQATPEQLWPFVSDTNRFNYDIRVPEVSVPDETARHRRSRNARRLLRLSMMGLSFEWEEQPFEWVRPSRFGVLRTYSRGPIEELRVEAQLSAHNGGTRLSYQLWARPKSLLGLIAIPLQFGLISARRFGEAFKRYDQLAVSQHSINEDQSVPPLSENTRTRLESLKEKLVNDGTAPPVAERLITFIQHAPDFLLARIRPYVLADEWRFQRRAVLEACLRATRIGLLDLRWDLICPLCRGPQESGTSLYDINSRSHCDTCQIDFTVSFDRFVEVTFAPNASLRSLEIKDYCLGSPQKTPHIVLQQLLAAKTTRRLQLPLEEGKYRLRVHELAGELAVLVSPAGAPSAAIEISEGGWTSEELDLAGCVDLELHNTTTDEQLVFLERLAWSDHAATAAEITALQVFRDLFSSEALRPGEQISVGTLTVLFTDLRNSTQLYREIGDATAFGRVMSHFDVLKNAIIEADGALVKTIGDAVMAVFRNSASALKATLKAQERLASPLEGVMPLTLKAGIHVGPCIAVTLNDRLDYFGSTVNIAARLESLSTGSDVVISGSVYDDPEVRALLRSLELDVEVTAFEMPLKGFAEERFALWRIGRTQAPVMGRSTAA